LQLDRLERRYSRLLGKYVWLRISSSAEADDTIETAVWINGRRKVK